ncbi:protein FAM107B-like isoform X2 [Seriola dumerili]|nr:protein FAM107B-like isoform X2 [Seriola dumerili]XP_022597956.1 protein FAM107B-like isoform X2 [Seriola dumerili]
MGAAYGKKKAYTIDHEPPLKQQCVKNGKHPNGKASAYADLQQHRSEGVHRKPSPVSSYVPQPDYVEGDEEDDLIKPKKLVNPVKASKSHQELHRELLSSYKRGGVTVETKPELHRVLESRKRDQLIKQRKQEDEARKKISPLEAELLKRHKKLEELEKQQEKEQEENLKAPEFVKVKEKLRRTSFHSKEEKEV